MLRLTWPRVNWEAGNPIGIFVSKEAKFYMKNYANKEVQKKGLSGVGDDEVAPMMKLDAPISGKEGDSMTAYDIVGGSFDNEFEERDFMEKLYRYLKNQIPQGRQSTEAQIASLGTFLGVDKDGEFTGKYIPYTQAKEEGPVNATKQSIYNWYNTYTGILQNLKRTRPELFNEEKNRIQKIAGIK